MAESEREIGSLRLMVSLSQMLHMSKPDLSCFDLSCSKYSIHSHTCMSILFYCHDVDAYWLGKFCVIVRTLLCNLARILVLDCNSYECLSIFAMYEVTEPPMVIPLFFRVHATP